MTGDAGTHFRASLHQFDAKRDHRMRSKKVIVYNEHGIHACVAMRVLEKSRDIGLQVTICKGCEKADSGALLWDAVLFFDGAAMEFRKINVARDPNCPVCGKDRRGLYSLPSFGGKLK